MNNRPCPQFCGRPAQSPHSKEQGHSENEHTSSFHTRLLLIQCFPQALHRAEGLRTRKDSGVRISSRALSFHIALRRTELQNLRTVKTDGRRSLNYERRTPSFLPIAESRARGYRRSIVRIPLEKKLYANPARQAFGRTRSSSARYLTMLRSGSAFSALKVERPSPTAHFKKCWATAKEN